MPDDLLSIGRFARLCRLSVKQLRHYDEAGLLPPSRVDPATGYRYYTAAQAGDALTIALLRDLDVPLAAIARVLAADGVDRAAALTAERDRLAEKIARDTERLALLERLADGVLPAYTLEVVDEPALDLAAVRATATRADLGEKVGGCIGALLAAVGGRAWRPPVWGLFPLDVDGSFEVGAGVRADDTPGTVRVRLPAGRSVTTVHTGGYAELPLAYTAVFSWIHERGLRPLPPVREAYLVAPGEAAPHELVTRIVVPVAE
ncbi:MAG: MerR family transcriptional regulator [Hamadaea sp.]|nr:MerR family transcriptional regulator [Hamadaea sp.]